MAESYQGSKNKAIWNWCNDPGEKSQRLLKEIEWAGKGKHCGKCSKEVEEAGYTPIKQGPIAK